MRETIYIERNYMNRKPYRFRNFLFDCLMILLTGGLWLIWVFCREMRK